MEESSQINDLSYYLREIEKRGKLNLKEEERILEK